MNTASVMHSGKIFSCRMLQSAEPYRLAGTCKTYSKNATPQLARIAIQSGFSLNFKWPYYARFINVFEKISRMIVFILQQACNSSPQLSSQGFGLRGPKIVQLRGAARSKTAFPLSCRSKAWHFLEPAHWHRY
jgi:hypothetical protein